MAIEPVGFGQAAIHYRRTADTGDYVVTFGFTTTEPHDIQSIADSVGIAWRDAMPTTHFNNEMSLYSANVAVQTEGGGDEQGVSVLNLVGSASGALATQNCAILAKKMTARAGRRGRGRMYLPWVLEDNVNTVGMLTPTYVTAINTCLSNLVSYLSGTTHGAISTPMYLLHSAGSTEAPPPDLVTNIFADPLIATQRRRLR